MGQGVAEVLDIFVGVWFLGRWVAAGLFKGVVVAL